MFLPQVGGLAACRVLKPVFDPHFVVGENLVVVEEPKVIGERAARIVRVTHHEVSRRRVVTEGLERVSPRRIGLDQGNPSGEIGVGRQNRNPSAGGCIGCPAFGAGWILRQTRSNPPRPAAPPPPPIPDPPSLAPPPEPLEPPEPVVAPLEPPPPEPVVEPLEPPPPEPVVAPVEPLPAVVLPPPAPEVLVPEPPAPPDPVVVVVAALLPPLPGGLLLPLDPSSLHPYIADAASDVRAASFAALSNVIKLTPSVRRCCISDRQRSYPCRRKY